MDWTVAHQAPLSMGFSRQEYWRGLLFPPLGDLPDPGVELASLNVSCVGRQVCILVSPGKSVHILRNGRLITSFFFFFHFKRHFKTDIHQMFTMCLSVVSTEHEQRSYNQTSWVESQALPRDLCLSSHLWNRNDNNSSFLRVVVRIKRRYSCNGGC